MDGHSDWAGKSRRGVDSLCLLAARPDLGHRDIQLSIPACRCRWLLRYRVVICRSDRIGRKICQVIAQVEFVDVRTIARDRRTSHDDVVRKPRPARMSQVEVRVIAQFGITGGIGWS